MKKVWYDSWLARMLLYFSDCHTIMLFGFVFSTQKQSEMTQATRNHECVHARQWMETTLACGSFVLTGVLSLGFSPGWLLASGMFFYLWYVAEWACKAIWYAVTGSQSSAYRDVSFEREARFAAWNSNYLENGNYFAWLREL